MEEVTLFTTTAYVTGHMDKDAADALAGAIAAAVDRVIADAGQIRDSFVLTMVDAVTIADDDSETRRHLGSGLSV